MIRILKLVFLLVIGQVAFAQAPSNYTNINGRYRWIAGMFDSTFHIPKGTTPSLRTGGSTNGGALFYKTADSSLQVYTGTQWLRMLKVGDTTGMLTPYFNSVGVGLKSTGQQVYADTLLLSTRLWRQKGIDSVAALINNNVSGISGYLSKFDGTNSIDTSQIYQNDGRIGIGTISPSAKLHVLGADQCNIRVESTGVGAGIDLKDNTTSAINQVGIGALGDDLCFRSGGAAAGNMRLTAAGNLGIGTNSPDSMLTVLQGARFERGVRMSGLPTGVGTKALRIDASGTLSIADTLANGISGSGTTNYIPKFTSSSAIGNSVIYEASGSIGIGTTTPNSYDASGNNLVVYENGNAGITIATPSTGYGNLFFADGSGSAAAYSGYIEYNHNNDAMAFGTTSTERMRLTSTGLGIGTSSPVTKLNVVGANAAVDGYGQLTVYSNSAMGADVGGGVMIGGAWTSGGALTYFGSIQARKENSTSGNVAGYLQFGTTLSNGTHTEKMRLDASGNLGLGVTPSAWSLFKVLQINVASFGGYSNNAYINSNAYYDSVNEWTYINTANGASRYELNNSAGGSHRWYTAPSGTAGNAISFTQAMTLDASGRLALGTSTFPNQNIGSLAGSAIFNGIVRISGSSINYFTSGDGLELSKTSIYSYNRDASVYNDLSINDAMTVKGAGNVGIGTTSPNTISGSVSTLSLGGTNATISGGISYQVNGTVKMYHYVDTDGLFIHQGLSGVGQKFFTNGSERMRITSGGDLLIGTTSASHYNTTAAVVYGSTNAGFVLKTATSGTGINDGVSISLISDNSLRITNYESNGVIRLETQDTERMRITSGGELLINTTSDAGDYKLQVNGNVYINGQGNYPNIGNFTNLQTYTSNQDKAITNFYQAQNYPSSNSYTRVFDIVSSGDATGGGVIRFLTSAGNNAPSAALTLTTSQNAEFAGSIKTAAPSGGSAKPYKFGEAGVAIGGSDGYAVKVEIDGTLYYLMTGYLPEPEPEAMSGPSMGYKAKFEEPVIKIKSDNQKIKDLEKEIAELKELIKSKIK